MVIFTARQNLANLNEFKKNLIVKFGEYGREILYYYYYFIFFLFFFWGGGEDKIGQIIES